MRKIEQIIKYMALFVLVLGGMLLLNMFLFFGIIIYTDDSSAEFPVRRLAKQLEQEGGGVVGISQEGISLLEDYRCFAMLLDGEGRIIWEYKLPGELWKQYSLPDVAVFSKWYLADYPVSCWVMDENLLVVGARKNLIWKYNIAFTISALELYARTIPLIGLVDLCISIFLPILFLRRHNEKMQQERTAWIAGVSHDIRTPLALVMGYADELTREGSGHPRELAERIERESLKIRRLVTNLNTENKMSYGRVKWEKEKICFAAFLREELCDFMNRDMEGRYDFQIEIDAAAEQMFIRGNRELLGRMIENLLNNATGHNPDGCQIRVRLSRTGRNRWVFGVEDDGCGIPEKVLRDIHRKNKKNILPERGLGLRLIYRIARFHGFRVYILAGEGKGMSCKIFFSGISGRP